MNPDRTFDARFGDRTPRVGDVFTVIHDNENVGEVAITSVTSGRIAGGPTEGFLGRPKVGDQLVFARPAEVNAPNTTWINWSAPDSGYKIFAPRHHEARVKSQKRGKMTVEEKLDIFSDVAQKQVYIVCWFDVPEGFLTSEETSSESESVKEELKKHEFAITARKVINFQGMECLEQDIQMTDTYARQRVFLTSRRVYQLIAVSAYREISPRSLRFFNSFQLMASAGSPLKAPPSRAWRDRYLSCEPLTSRNRE